MILVDVYVPAVDKEYNFSLDEEVSVKTILDEIIEMIEQKEQTKLKGNQDDMLLCDKKNGKVLARTNSLKECGILNGDSMILV
ncbi:MAG: glutamyl-tRNA amidotransferase [Lachnospiraceae bacterium]|nr:glutamyl-tRNA amidotransferase [Lachnospiraceae bacterium]